MAFTYLQSRDAEGRKKGRTEGRTEEEEGLAAEGKKVGEESYYVDREEEKK